MQTQVQLYGCFKSDKRLSMEIYAEQLQHSLLSANMRVHYFTPKHALERFSGSRMLMRYLRYRHYARQIKRQKNASDVHHIVDHGYAHLHPSLGRGKSVITAHDLIPLLTWKKIIPSRSAVRRPHLNIHSLNFLQRFDAVLAPSVSTANDLEHYLGLSPTKVHVVSPVIADYFKPCSEQAVTEFKREHSIAHDVKTILITGREHYKNLETSLAVIKNLLSLGHNIKILRAGWADQYVEGLLSEHGLLGHVQSLFLPRHEDLALLYNSVDCLLFPSWYEGFGMPVAEALACGTPVVSSNAASLPEAGGELALSTEPDDVDGLTDLVLTCLNDEQHKAAISQQGERWATQFRAPNLSQKIIKAYQL